MIDKLNNWTAKTYGMLISCLWKSPGWMFMAEWPLSSNLYLGGAPSILRLCHPRLARHHLNPVRRRKNLILSFLWPGLEVAHITSPHVLGGKNSIVWPTQNALENVFHLCVQRRHSLGFECQIICDRDQVLDPGIFDSQVCSFCFSGFKEFVSSTPKLKNIFMLSSSFFSILSHWRSQNK